MVGIVPKRNIDHAGLDEWRGTGGLDNDDFTGDALKFWEDFCNFGLDEKLLSINC